MANIKEIKDIIKEHIKSASCGMFFSRNFVGDKMNTVYRKNGIRIDICYGYEYFEIFGLSEGEENEIIVYYDSLVDSLYDDDDDE